MYKIKDEIINEVCEKLGAIARLSLEVQEQLRSSGGDVPRGRVDYDPDEYILQHLEGRQGVQRAKNEDRR